MWSERTDLSYEARLASFSARTVQAASVMRIRVTRAFKDGIGSSSFTIMDIYGTKSTKKKKGSSQTGSTTGNTPEPPEDNSITVSELSKRLKDNLRSLHDRSFQPIGVDAMPQVGYNPKKHVFELQLPPFTAVETDNALFFSHGMLIRGSAVLPRGLVVEKDGRRFVNRSDRTKVLSSESSIPPEQTMRDSLPDDVRETPVNTVFTVELLPLPVSLNIDLPANSGTDKIVERLNLLLEESLKSLHLPTDLLRAERVSSSELKLKLFYQSSARSHVAPRIEMPGDRVLLNFPTKLDLDLQQPFDAVYEVSTFGEDPLANKYPVALVSLNYGPAQSYVVGAGPHSILALVHDSRHILHAIRSTEFLKSYFLQLTLTDRFFVPITMTKTTEFYLTFELTALNLSPRHDGDR